MTMVLAFAALCWAAQSASADAKGPSPVADVGSLDCNLNCVDTWSIECHQKTRFIVARVVAANCSDNLLATMTVRHPAAMVGAADANHTFNASCEEGAGVVVERTTAGEGAVYATVAVQSIASGSATRDYTIFAGCFTSMDDPKFVYLFEKNDE
jgi:hypothetical protein